MSVPFAVVAELEGEMCRTEPDDVLSRAIDLRYEPRWSIVVPCPCTVKAAMLAPGLPVVVGRGPGADLCVLDQRLSRRHARFTLAGNRVLVEDLSSTNGTWIDGARVTRGEVDVGDTVRLASVVVCVQMLGPTGEDLGLDGEGRFRRRLDEEAVRARHFGRPFAALSVRVAADRRGSRDAPTEHVARWAASVRSKLRAVDRMALHGPDAVLILLPEAGADAALAIGDAIARIPAPCPSLRVGVAVWPEAATTSEEILEAAARASGCATSARPVEIAEAASVAEGESAHGDGPVFGSARMLDLLETARRVAASRLPVILHGETGTGKEVLARILHEGAPRRQRRMVRVNCGAIPPSLVESTLFGHEKGAFTGAVGQQKGVFEEADGGTVFLDEIGELPLVAQAALLRVLETGCFCRVGSSQEITVDVRIVAATHRDLDAMAASGAFRADLYYRLSAVTLEIPPLRERPTEIVPLAMRFLRAANRANGRVVQRIEPEARARLLAYAWPGNVRELRNAIERAVVVTGGDAIGIRDLPLQVQALEGPREAHERSLAEPTGAPAGSASELFLDSAGDLRDRMRRHELRLLDDALRAAGWNRAEAAKRLNMPLRTLSHKMKVLGLRKLDP
jgi:DNA-binding NtrC family response regulator